MAILNLQYTRSIHVPGTVRLYSSRARRLLRFKIESRDPLYVAPERERDRETDNGGICRILCAVLSDIGTFTKLTGGWPILDVTGAMYHRIILTIPRRRTQGVPLLDTVQPMRCGHIACRLQVTDLHAADETSSRTHAQSHRGCKESEKFRQLCFLQV